MSVLMEQHGRWKAAHTRLMGRVKETAVRRRDFMLVASAELPGTVAENAAGVVVIPEAFRWKRILMECAANYGVTVVDLISKRRTRQIVLARHEAYYRLSTETTLSMPQIGKKLGGRDHTSIFYGIKMHKARLAMM